MSARAGPEPRWVPRLPAIQAPVPWISPARARTPAAALAAACLEPAPATALPLALHRCEELSSDPRLRSGQVPRPPAESARALEAWNPTEQVSARLAAAPPAAQPPAVQAALRLRSGQGPRHRSGQGPRLSSGQG